VSTPVAIDESLPAWADAFAPERLGRAPRLALPAELTREWAFGSGTGAGVRVAVIDSGVDAEHPAVGGVDGHVIVEYDIDAEGSVRFVEGAHGDLYGHGNACAGIIRALAPEVELYSVRVLGERLTGKARCFAAGLDWAIEQGMHVVNMSLSTTNEDWFETFHDLADQALRQRIMVVCALSNEAKVSIPAEFASVFSVAATTTDNPELLLANPTPPAEWGARGIDVPVAWLNGSAIVATGNSFAAPHVAGMLARMLGEHPGLTCWQAKTILTQLADNRS
jgi:subtilisin